MTPALGKLFRAWLGARFDPAHAERYFSAFSSLTRWDERADPSTVGVAFALLVRSADAWAQERLTVPVVERTQLVPLFHRTREADSGLRRGTMALPIDLAEPDSQALRRALRQVPGISDALAQRVVEYRHSHGPFEALSALRAVDSAANTFDLIYPHLTVASATIEPPDPPVDFVGYLDWLELQASRRGDKCHPLHTLVVLERCAAEARYWPVGRGVTAATWDRRARGAAKLDGLAQVAQAPLAFVTGQAYGRGARSACWCRASTPSAVSLRRGVRPSASARCSTSSARRSSAASRSA